MDEQEKRETTEAEK
jgi:hypothetical protein